MDLQPPGSLVVVAFIHAAGSAAACSSGFGLGFLLRFYPGELKLDGSVLLQFAEPSINCSPQHYALLVDDEHLDRAMAWIRSQKHEHWGDSQQPAR